MPQKGCCTTQPLLLLFLRAHTRMCIYLFRIVFVSHITGKIRIRILSFLESNDFSYLFFTFHSFIAFPFFVFFHWHNSNTNEIYFSSVSSSLETQVCSCSLHAHPLLWTPYFFQSSTVLLSAFFTTHSIELI